MKALPNHWISIVGALLWALVSASLCSCVTCPAPTTIGPSWDDTAGWIVTSNDLTTTEIKNVLEPKPGIQVNYQLGGDHGFVQLRKLVGENPSTNPAVTFLMKAEGTGQLEVKFVSGDGSTYGAKVPLPGNFMDWRRVTVYRNDLEYWWEGNDVFNQLAEFHIAISTKGSGTVWLAGMGWAANNMPSAFTRDPNDSTRFFVPRTGPSIDPDSELPGIGLKQRRAESMNPEDPRVLEWLETLQDVSSPGQQMLPTTEDNECQTFNNALAAMAFMVKGEKERAERILNFFAAATDRSNTDPTLQNFFYKGEARGFYQRVALNDKDGVKKFHTYNVCDRWMGDMAWLLFAYEYYGKKYDSKRYAEISGLIRDLLVSWYTDDPKTGGGYVQHGWRKGDKKLHEGFGHEEGNIDCYALFRLLGDENRANKIRTWIEARATGKSLPLDLYTWRVLAYDGGRAELLNIPDYDLRYRKTVVVNGKEAVGPFHTADSSVTNIWLDGLGHIACAYLAAGNRERGQFYANQMDAFLMESKLGGKTTMTLPYTANNQGGFDFDQSKGYISVAAWYIFAKNRFNPMTLKTAE